MNRLFKSVCTDLSEKYPTLSQDRIVPSVDLKTLALAERRVHKALEIVARQRGLIHRFTLADKPSERQASLLSLFKQNLALFEEHAARLEEG